jgi:hypothetical protein
VGGVLPQDAKANAAMMARDDEILMCYECSLMFNK